MAEDEVNGRLYTGLDLAFDKDHRARAIERGETLSVVRMMSHTLANQMLYDVRYEPYFERAGLLPFVLQFKRVPPSMCHSALTALVDRWRPETQLSSPLWRDDDDVGGLCHDHCASH